MPVDECSVAVAGSAVLLKPGSDIGRSPSAGANGSPGDRGGGWQGPNRCERLWGVWRRCASHVDRIAAQGLLFDPVCCLTGAACVTSDVRLALPNAVALGR